MAKSTATKKDVEPVAPKRIQGLLDIVSLDIEKIGSQRLAQKIGKIFPYSIG